ncbi:hypothetical protein GCM10028772_39350 [Nocardioides ultimimeridianus]
MRVDGGGWLSGEAALAAVTEVRRRLVAAGEADPLDEAADLRLRHHGLGDGWVMADGFALRAGEVLDLAVAPDARGDGLGRRLGEAACAAPGPLTAWSHGDHPAARRLAGRLGFTADRELWVMRRPAGVLPEGGGVRVRSFTPTDTQALLEINAAAFAHHPEQGGMDAAGLAERMAEPWYDPADLLVAEDPDGTLVGFHWTKLHDARHGEVYVVGVAPSAQGRGLGRVLTVAGLNHLARRGVAEILLYVESDNVPARRLYESLGFTHRPDDTHLQFRRSA